MQRVKHFQKRSMTEIEYKINDFLKDNPNIKIVNIALTHNASYYHALVTYEIN